MLGNKRAFLRAVKSCAQAVHLWPVFYKHNRRRCKAYSTRSYCPAPNEANDFPETACAEHLALQATTTVSKTPARLPLADVRRLQFRAQLDKSCRTVFV
jgi:hypothetical protein